MFLDDIIAHTRQEVARRKQALPQAELAARAKTAPPPLSFKRALDGPGLKLIAEVKKAAPSRGVIRADFDPVAIALTYAEGGAAALSMLTEEKYFQGSLDYLRDAKMALGGRLPVMRKDFIIDPYQVYEARAYGADAFLLIVVALNRESLAELLALGRKLGMDALVEAHNEAELGLALAAGADIIGINNRDLKTFKVDLDTTRRLMALMPPGKTVVAESGIKNRQDIEKVRGWGVNAALVGEALTSSPDIAARMRELIG